MLDRFEAVIQLVNQRNTGGDIQPDDLILGDGIQVFHQRPQRISMRRDQHPFAALHHRHDGFMPVGQKALHGILQALAGGQFLLGQVRVTRVFTGVALIGFLQGWRAGIVAPPPDVHLLFAKFGGHLGFIQALQRAVMALVQAPGIDHRQVHAVHFIQRDPERADRPFKNRGVTQVKIIPTFLERLSCLVGFQQSFFREIHVGPAGEAVFHIPRAFAVAQ